jgi:hypothetical protein
MIRPFLFINKQKREYFTTGHELTIHEKVVC